MDTIHNTKIMIDSLKDRFTEHQDKEKAPAMYAYMKGLFPFYGISAVGRRALIKDWMKEFNLKSEPELSRALIRELYALEEREMHYSALELLVNIPKKQLQPEDIDLIEFTIVNRSWWDSVDTIASNVVGPYMKKFPEFKNEIIEKWRKSPNIWLNRTCLIFQLKYRNDTDTDLLFSLIMQFKGSKEFFIRKAIGWSLRELSKWNKEIVREFVDFSKIDGLAKREATKYL